MAGKKELQKTISFRLNMGREEEREIYEAIMSHSRNIEDDDYGSSGAYIKTAIKAFMNQEQKEQMQSDVQKILEKHIKHIVDSVVETLTTKPIEVCETKKEIVPETAEDQMPEEAFSYLQNL